MLIEVIKAEVTITSAKYLSNFSLSVMLNCNLKMKPGNIIVTGSNLWKLSVWGSPKVTNKKTKIGFYDQALNDKQMATPLALYKSNDEFDLKNVQVTIDLTNDRSMTVNAVCVRFGKADLTDTRFEVVGVNKHDKPKPSHLTGCAVLETF